jgi:serine/threonine-protein kinase
MGMALESPAAPEGKYRVLAELGEGGTATVHLAVAQGPSGFNKLVVCKTLKRSLSDNSEFRRMFLKEARLAARLNHANIVQTNEVAEERGLPVIVMEYLEGQPLSNVLQRSAGKLDLGIHLRVIAEALKGLHYAHELTDFDGTRLGLVHRDITPHNVFVTFDGQTKLLDFGIAKLVAAKSDTEIGVIKGKFRYMSPEQIVGGDIDHRADIYSVGVLLWEAAAGVPLWKDAADAVILNRVSNGEIPSPREIRPVPERLEAICMKALAYDPNDRHGSAAELEADVESFLDEFGSRVTDRAIGQAVAKLFDDVRAQTKTLIDAQMSHVASLSWEDYAAIDPPAMRFSQSAEGARQALADRVGSPRRWKPYALLGLAALALASLVAWRTGQAADTSGGPASNPSQTVSTATPRPVATPIARATIRVSASPPESKIFFDGELLPANPFVRVLPADGSQHIVRAVAPGHETKSKALVASGDSEISLELERLTPTETKTRPRATAPARRTSPAAVPKPNCSSPYSIGPDGTKKFKLECL